MDSFDIMNPCLDSMLPPGELFRRTFDSSLMGLESRADEGPDWVALADANYEQAANNYNYDWEQVQRQYKHMLLQNEIQRRDQITQHAYQTAQQEQQWMFANAQKEQKFNADMAAFNKSERMYGWQVEMNHIAGQMGRDDQAAQTEERYQALHFETLTELAKHSQKKTDLSMQGLGVDLDVYSKRTASQRQKQELTINQQAKRGVAAAQGIEETVKAMQVMGQAKAKGQAGGSAAKQYQAIAAQTSRLEAARAYEMNRSDLATRLALNGVDQTMAEQEAAANLANVKIGQAGFYNDIDKALGIEQQEATKLSIGSAHDRANRKIAHDIYSANVKADMGRMSKPSMGIPIPKPLEIPMATIIDPIVPVKGKPPVWGAGSQAASAAASTGGGGSTGIGGLISGAGGLMSGLAGANIGAFGVTASFGTMLGPIGAGVALVGLAGELFDWW